MIVKNHHSPQSNFVLRFTLFTNISCFLNLLFTKTKEPFVSTANQHLGNNWEVNDNNIMSTIAMFIVTLSVVIREQFLWEVTARKKELTTIKNTVILFVCPSNILHKHCVYLVLGPL